MTATDAPRAAAAVERVWSPDAALACYSVRSGFHLLLAALEEPHGSEVLFSSVTHPDMARIVRHHGLVPVPLDLAPETLAPPPRMLERAITAQTRLLVVAHLFGGHVDLEPLAAICRRHGLLLVEDCAQSFQGPPDTGEECAAVSMFSFGILKTATALGGALLTVRDPMLLARLRELQRRWPLQTRRSHLKRIHQAAVFVALTRPRPYALVSSALGARFDGFVNSAARAFPAGSTDELVRRLERRPAAPLLELMRHRLETFDHARLMARCAAGEHLAALLPEGLHVGGYALDHSHWLFPVLGDDPDALIAAARSVGFDAARSASSVKPVTAPDSRPDLDPVCARKMMERLVFLPAYPELPPGALQRLASVVKGYGAHAHVAR
jgi:dTDP-4-amino-4,6-dideoxygalactose transaminase